jgi:hypothetical protein
MTTESGHIVEIDDTLGVERMAIEHRSGTFHEIHPDGSEVTRIVNDNYTVVAKDNKLIVGGNVDVSVEKGNVRIAVATGNADIYVAGHTDLMVDGNVNASIGGTLNADVVGNTTFTSPETLMTTNLTVDGTVHVTKTTHSVGDVSTDAGNAPTLATHVHKSTSKDTGVGANAGVQTDTTIPDA